jgi:predicted ArsR family transcriptional regulator
VRETWVTRELPVLDATVAMLDESYMVTVSDIAGRTGLDAATVARALEALDPDYVDFRKTTTGGDPTFWYVLKATPQARRAVGQWPTPDSFVTKLAAELSAAASSEEDAERRTLISYAARLIGDTLRDVAVRAAGQVLAPSIGPVADLPRAEPRASETRGETARAEPSGTPEMPVSAD